VGGKVLVRAVRALHLLSCSVEGIVLAAAAQDDRLEGALDEGVVLRTRGVVDPRRLSPRASRRDVASTRGVMLGSRGKRETDAGRDPRERVPIELALRADELDELAPPSTHDFVC
jgi:hypothetical protein